MEKKTVFADWKTREDRCFLTFPEHGHVLPDPAYRMTPVGVCMLSYIVSGKGAVLTEDTLIPVQAGDLCCIRPGAEVICRTDFNEPYEVDWFFLRGRLVDSLCALYDMPPVFVTPFDARGYFRQWEALLVTACPRRREMESVCRSLTESVCALFAGVRLSAVLDLPPAAEDVTFAVRDYLDDHIAEPVTLAGLADRFGYTDMHIIRLFREEFGLPPMQYLHKKRMEHGKRLLAETRLSLSDVAAQCGYRDRSHFSAAFTKYTGQSPRMYKKAKNGAIQR